MAGLLHLLQDTLRHVTHRESPGAHAVLHNTVHTDFVLICHIHLSFSRRYCIQPTHTHSGGAMAVKLLRHGATCAYEDERVGE